MNIFVGVICVAIGLTMLVIAGVLAWDLWDDWKSEKKFGEGNKLR